ncbi:MAG: hypothetical protein M2R45_00434 [Verrucomicrobia subdivision 3 bacterium]|nr:hypothetical protein [Limisphaerales bacterium]MCS1413686.1 hypothetical protein [Limisphaerales bacterium]
MARKSFDQFIRTDIAKPFNVTARLMARKFPWVGALRAGVVSFNVTARLMARKFVTEDGTEHPTVAFNVTARLMARKFALSLGVGARQVPSM